jgi:hypothetical protein
LIFYIARSYPEWQKAVLIKMKEHYDNHKEMPSKQVMNAALKENPSIPKNLFGSAMAFAAAREKEFSERGERVLKTSLPFDEFAVVQEHLEIITRGLGLPHLHIFASDDPAAPDPVNRKSLAVPGNPSFCFRTE